jgi:hypothetical protein
LLYRLGISDINSCRIALAGFQIYIPKFPMSNKQEKHGRLHLADYLRLTKMQGVWVDCTE